MTKRAAGRVLRASIRFHGAYNIYPPYRSQPRASHAASATFFLDVSNQSARNMKTDSETQKRNPKPKLNKRRYDRNVVRRRNERQENEAEAY